MVIEAVVVSNSKTGVVAERFDVCRGTSSFAGETSFANGIPFCINISLSLLNRY